MTSKNADYDQLFPCNADGVSVNSHQWVTVPGPDSGDITKCLRCRIVQLSPAVTGENIFPHGPYEIPNAHARRDKGNVVYAPHVMQTIGDAYDAFRTAPGNRDGSFPTRRHFVNTLTAGGMNPDEAVQLYERNQHSFMEFHRNRRPDVANIPLL